MLNKFAKKKIKLRIVDWYGDNAETEEVFYKNQIVIMLQEKFNVIYSDTPDFIIFGPFGDNHLKYDCVRIFCTGENVRPDYNIADYSIDFDFLDFGDRHFQAYWGARPDFDKISTKHLITDEQIESKSKFCAFMVSNSSHPFTCMREKCFEKLNQYKKVDSAGRYKNNIDYKVSSKIQWLKDYKFNICFENSSYPGYLTEKLFDAYAAGCVPIYWGDTSLRLFKDENLDNLDSKNQDYKSLYPKDSKYFQNLGFTKNMKSAKKVLWGGGGLRLGSRFAQKKTSFNTREFPRKSQIQR